MAGSILAVALAVADISGSESENLPAPCFAGSNFESTMKLDSIQRPLEQCSQDV